MAQPKRRSGPKNSGGAPAGAKAAAAKAAADEARARRAAKADAEAAAARRHQRRKAARRGAVIAGLGALVVLAASLVWRNRQAEQNLRQEMTATGCRFDTRADAGRGDTGNTTFSVDPPSGGPHGLSPANSGTYLSGNVPDDGAVVHALEHGRIAIWYRPDLPKAELDGLLELLDVRRSMVLILPRPSLSVPVAATAWQRRLLCPRPEVEPLSRFIRAYVNKGPERQPA